MASSPIQDAWYKTSLTLSALGAKLRLHVPHDVFSTQQIDEGTLLLLENLPPSAPSTVLDMGCGYGALGLPIAAKFSSARVEMVDRDLLAVEWTKRNALENQLSGVVAYGSLGFRDLPTPGPAYDWILCNIPARIGRPFIANFLSEGRARLKAGGELRVVVIRDLAPLLTELGAIEAARGPRHVVFCSSPASAPSPGEDLYFRDQVSVDGLALDRPFDLGGDDPKRLAKGLPVLIDALPRQAPLKPFRRILCFRSGYGPMPLVSLKRWPEAEVVAIDRDLLATTFVRRNAKNQKLDIREAAHFPDALGAEERFNLILGELSPSAGERVAGEEILAVARSLAPGGRALLLALDKLERDWVRPLALRHRLTILPLISRDGFTVLNLAGPA
jgi:16S rRNA (guanine1207-N2)-methyltransferase